MFRLSALLEPTVAACVVIAFPGIGPAGAQPACDDFIAFAQRPTARDWRYSLLDKVFTYQPGMAGAGTEAMM